MIDSEGSVVGVVVSQLNAQAFLENYGSIPQNMNFAVPTDVLVGFLRNSGAEFRRRTGSDFDVSDGLPTAVENAVVPVFCY